MCFIIQNNLIKLQCANSVLWVNNIRPFSAKMCITYHFAHENGMQIVKESDGDTNEIKNPLF